VEKRYSQILEGFGIPEALRLIETVRSRRVIDILKGGRAVYRANHDVFHKAVQGLLSSDEIFGVSGDAIGVEVGFKDLGPEVVLLIPEVETCLVVEGNVVFTWVDGVRELPLRSCIAKAFRTDARPVGDNEKLNRMS